jgi:hypothetical protein
MLFFAKRLAFMDASDFFATPGPASRIQKISSPLIFSALGRETKHESSRRFDGQQESRIAVATCAVAQVD